ncbi:MAG TPA: hypothetical protein ENF41_04420 [Candidatus Bathyarchaeota archaeon]|nr:hypothetical protein [Candidatus Bathyarchaeota archaeon]
MKTCAIVSVKGGVGKTLISINVARRLVDKYGMANKVALIDADIDNSNFAQFTGVDARIEITDDIRYKPYDWNGVQVFSMSLLAGRDKSISMEADRYVQILADAIECAEWKDVEYIIIDMPGTASDIFKACMEFFADTLIGNIVVCQPNMIDATKRILNLHQYYGIPVIGLIENMSYFICPYHKNPKVFHIFGESTVEQIAEEYNVPILGKVPLLLEVSKGLKRGEPYIPEKYIEPIDNACEVIIKEEIKKLSLLEKFKKMALEAIKPQVEKVLAYLLVSINRDFDIRTWKDKVNWKIEKRPIMLTITDESGRKEITRMVFRVYEDKVTFVKNPKQVDFEIVASFRTLARMIMGERKVGDKIVKFDPIDAWLNGEVKVYGIGYSPRAFKVFQNVFGNEELMEQIRNRYGKVLRRWI